MGAVPFIMSDMLCSEGCWRARNGDLFCIVGDTIRLVPENSELVLVCLCGLASRDCWRVLLIESAADEARGRNAWTSDMPGWVFISQSHTSVPQVRDLHSR